MAMAAAAEQRALKPMGSMGRAPPQQDLVAALNARIAKENAELTELRAKVAKERERYVSMGGQRKHRTRTSARARLRAHKCTHTCMHAHTLTRLSTRRSNCELMCGAGWAPNPPVLQVCIQPDCLAGRIPGSGGCAAQADTAATGWLLCAVCGGSSLPVCTGTAGWWYGRQCL
jgi:hypothetical protein